MDSDNKYRAAFHFMVGAITSRECLGLPPLPAKELFQLVYDEYGVKPSDGIVKILGLIVNEDDV